MCDSPWSAESGAARRRRPGLGLAAALLAVGLLLPSAARAADQEGCLLCHGLAGFGYVEAGGYRSLWVNPETFNASAHGELVCRDCHRQIVSVPHDGVLEKVNCGLECHGMTSQNGKAYSHESLYWGFMGSAHGQGGRSHSDCRFCHPRDPVPVTASQALREGTAGCVACHLDDGFMGRFGLKNKRAGDYFRDIHGRIMLAGGRSTPACPDCHSQHAVLPSSKESSPTHGSRVATTCAGSLRSPAGGCHRKAATAALLGMSPLKGGGWSDYPGGALFYFAGLFFTGLLVLRAILGVIQR